MPLPLPSSPPFIVTPPSHHCPTTPTTTSQSPFSSPSSPSDAGAAPAQGLLTWLSRFVQDMSGLWRWSSFRCCTMEVEDVLPILLPPQHLLPPAFLLGPR